MSEVYQTTNLTGNSPWNSKSITKINQLSRISRPVSLLMESPSSLRLLMREIDERSRPEMSLSQMLREVRPVSPVM